MAPASELQRIADELYALRPDAFATARDEQVRKARAAGDKPLARELGQLKRPTQSAWLLNLLWRDQRAGIQHFLDIGQQLSQAQARGAGAELRSLTARRLEVEAGLLRRAQALALQNGVNVSASLEREMTETLAAALARAEVADEIRSGRLVKPASYAGFGTPVEVQTPAGAAAAGAVESGQDRPGGEEPASKLLAFPAGRPVSAEDTQEQRARELREQADRRARERRQQAQQRLQDARSALETASAALVDETHAAQAADQRLQTLRARLEELDEQLRALQAEVRAAQNAALLAAHKRDQTEGARAAARQAVDEAEEKLATLG